MPDISGWLHGLGLGRYAQAFEERGIDFEALPNVTEDMLEQIGLPIGPRARLRAAIAKLASASDNPRGERGRALEPARGERRQITVMFCDLVESTRLAQQLDPEEYGSVMQAYQKACGEVIQRYDGHISQYRGDGIEVYFGWPAAHEDAAERAVRAGLEVVEAVKALPSATPLSVRVGISTGIVVTGLGDVARPSAAVGETPYAAVRLQSLADPDSVVIADATSRLVSGRFDQEALEPEPMEGEQAPRAFRVRRVREDTSRFQAARAQTLTPFVGRRTELAFLQQRWSDAKDGEGQAVFVSGMPGIGKSRIVHELERSIEAEPHSSVGFQCLPHCMQSALLPVIRQVERLANLASDDSDHLKLQKIDALLSRAGVKTENAAALLAEMMSIPIPSRHPSSAATPQQIKAQTLFVFVELLLALARQHPLLCVIEDAQWIDPSTQEFLELLISRMEKARVLLVVSHRPEYQWHSEVHGYVSGLTMARLARRDANLMARLALRDQSVSPAAMRRIIEDSDSVPLFVEELARGATESAVGSDPDKSAPRIESDITLVPDSLRDSLEARLDRVPQARSVAQIAAVIGREFSYDMLRRVSSLTDAELDSSLAHLKETEIVQLVDDKPSARYAFKHALLRDAAYDSLLRSSRREIHGKVAATLEKEWPDVVAGQPELLAYHYSLAGKAEFAVRYWLLGGRRARARSAHVEATVQFQKALECLEVLPETRERIATKLEIQLSLGLCLIAVQGYSADETREAFERARSLSREVGEAGKEIRAIFGLWGHYWMRARHDRALELAETLLAKAEEVQDPMAVIAAHRSLGSTLFTLGHFPLARIHLERAIALGRESPTEESSLPYAVDPRVAAQLMLAWDLWIMGYPEQAHDHVRDALARAVGRADTYGIAFAHYVTSAVQLLRGEFEDSLAHADRSLALSREHRINLYALYSRFGRGCALARLGQRDHAIAEIREGIEEARRSNLGYMRGFMLGWLATMQSETGDPESALATVEQALAQVDDVSGRAWAAELERLRGDILLVARPDAMDEAERNYRQAIAIAQHQEARSLELRAVISLARLLRRRGGSEEARERLAPLVGSFTEGHDTADLRQAKALLEELG